MSPGSMPLAREIFQEGLIIPPVKLVRRGAIVDDVLAMILANVRTPDEREGDLTAQIAANRVGERRLQEIVAAHGARHGGRVCRRRAGPHRAGAARDDRGDPGRRVRLRGSRSTTTASRPDPIAIRVRLRIAGDGAIVDFTGSDPQTTGGVNANFAITLSATLYAFRCLVREDVLYNAGIGRVVEVIAPAGTIVNAVRPSAVAGGNVEASQRITDVVLGALAQALPARLPAASQGTMNNVTLGGRHPATGRPFAYYETIGGGMGARPGLDGISGVHTHMSNTRNTPIEAIEHYLPVRVRQYAIRAGSGGAGQWRGGDGIVREYEALTRDRGDGAVRSPHRRAVWRRRRCARAAGPQHADPRRRRDDAARQGAAHAGAGGSAAHRIAGRRRLREAPMTGRRGR